MARKVQLPTEVWQRVAEIKKAHDEKGSPFWVHNKEVIRLYYTWLVPCHPNQIERKVEGAMGCGACRKTIRHKWGRILNQ